MDYLGLLFELVFLALGVYLYLFSIGKMSSKDPETQKKAEAFRQNNKSWLRIASLLLIAIMTVNIYLHILELTN